MKGSGSGSPGIPGDFPSGRSLDTPDRSLDTPGHRHLPFNQSLGQDQHDQEHHPEPGSGSPDCTSPQSLYLSTGLDMSERGKSLHQDVDRKPCDITLQLTKPLKEDIGENNGNLSRPHLLSSNSSERQRENAISRRRWNRLLNDNYRGNSSTCPTRREADMPEELDHYPYIFFSPTLANLLDKSRNGALKFGGFMKRLLAALGRTAIAVLQFTIAESMGLLTMNMVGNAIHHQILDRELERAMDLKALGLQDAHRSLEEDALEEVEMISGPIMKDCSTYSNDRVLPNNAQDGKACQK